MTLFLKELEGVRVKIIGDHPHKNETGTMTGSVIDSPTKMSEIKLDDCPQMVESCYARKENIKKLR